MSDIFDQEYEFNNTGVDRIKASHYSGKKVGENWPVVYVIHNESEAYVGETHHAFIRMDQHLKNPDRQKLEKVRILTADDFNKSVILDLESFLIKHMSADGKFKLQNGNNGLQDHDYFDRKAYEDMFRLIWNQLQKDKIVSKSISEIENSALFKYSPFKCLGEEQLKVECDILDLLSKYSNEGTTITVRGGAGTGKTILAIYLIKLFSDINSGKIKNELSLEEFFEEERELLTAAEKITSIKKIGIVFPQATLKASVKEVFKDIPGLEDIPVMSTKELVDQYVKTREQFDLLIVDEAHRLKCRDQGHLSSYTSFDNSNALLGLDKMKGTELDWIMICGRNRILFRDELQTVRPCDINYKRYKEITEEKYSGQKCELALDSQWRCMGGNEYIFYVKKLLDGALTEKQSFNNYDFKLYENVDHMINDIKTLDKKYGLCRNAAGYAWKWISKKNKSLFDINIDSYHYRWNTTYENWIVTDNSINEIGCIHTLQGYDLNYVGLIIGEDLQYDVKTKTLKANKNNYYDQQGKSGVANDPEGLLGYIKNIYLTLLTRGIRGTYIYVCNKELREYLKNYIDVI